MSAPFVARSNSPIPFHIVAADEVSSWLETLPPPVAAFARATGFKGEAGRVLLSPDAEGGLGLAVLGAGACDDALVSASAAAAFPPGDYLLERHPKALREDAVHAGWADGAYDFPRYRTGSARPAGPRLVIKSTKAREAAEIFSAGANLARELIDTPAQDMGPDAIADAAANLAAEFGTHARIVTGDALLSENYPMIHAVGRAARAEPRYAEFEWGPADAPRVAIVGKGVAFDTGGLNLKTGNYMRIMKKDMGGAAHALGLARMVMASGLKLRLSVHIPTVENAIGADAFRPGDVLTSRKGLTVEIDNTDAEGRLILADALARACELEPELLLDFATLTGAARVALGSDIPPYFTNDDALAAGLDDASRKTGDPLWRLPLWKPYNAMLKSSVADVANGADSPFAGAITAALFLERFVSVQSWAHVDLWAWRNPKYGRPAGAAAMTLRAMLNYLQDRFGV